MIRLRFAVLLVFFFTAWAVFAQSNDVAVSFGGTFSPELTGLTICEAIPVCPTSPTGRSVDPSFSVEGTIAYRLENFRVAFFSFYFFVVFFSHRTKKKK